MAYLNGKNIPFVFQQTGGGGNMEHVVVTEWNPQNVKGVTTLDTVKEGQVIVLEFCDDSYTMTRFKINLVDASGNTVLEAWTTAAHGQNLFDAGDHATYRYNGEEWERIDVTNANQIFITDNAQLGEANPFEGLTVQRAIQDLYNSIGGANGSVGNLICETLIDETLTEAVLRLDYEIPNIDDYIAFHIYAHSAPYPELTANAEGLIEFRGLTIYRGNIIPYPGQLDTVKDYGKIAININVVEDVVLGTSFFRGTNWTTVNIGQPMTTTNNKVSLVTWGSRYFEAGTRFMVKGLKKI